MVNEESGVLGKGPVMSRVARYSGRTYITGTLTSTPDSSFTIEFYASAAPDASGFGEGQAFLGSLSVSTDATGQASFDGVVTEGDLVTWDVIDERPFAGEPVVVVESIADRGGLG